jgi:hypothetical protein
MILFKNKLVDIQFQNSKIVSFEHFLNQKDRECKIKVKNIYRALNTEDFHNLDK